MWNAPSAFIEALGLVACTKGTKEHESIVAIKAKPVHIHAALLLLGAEPGSPATRQQLGDQAERWIDVPPSGGPGGRFSGAPGQRGEDGRAPHQRFHRPLQHEVRWLRCCGPAGQVPNAHLSLCRFRLVWRRAGTAPIFERRKRKCDLSFDLRRRVALPADDSQPGQ